MIDPATVLCDARVCPVVREGRPVFYDAAHLTRSAAASVHGLFDALFRP